MSVQERTDGIVLRTRPLTESSLIVNWLTEKKGRISTVAKGARKNGSPFRGKLDLFYLADLSFVRARRSDLHTLREVVLTQPFAPIREDLSKVQQASYAAALIEQSTETETPIPQFFYLMHLFLIYLASRPFQPIAVFAFEIKILDLLGQSPEMPPASLSPGSQEVLKQLKKADFEFLPRLRASPRQELEIKQFLHGYLIYHLGKTPANRARALQNIR